MKKTLYLTLFLLLVIANDLHSQNLSIDETLKYI